MTFAFWMYAIAAALYRVRIVILERERHAAWVTEMMEAKK